jgi:hypothetical protein
LDLDLLRLSALGAVNAKSLCKIVNAAVFLCKELHRGPNKGEVHHDSLRRVVNGDTSFDNLLFQLFLEAFSFGACGQSARRIVGTVIALTVAELGDVILIKEAAEFRKRN